MLDRIHAAPTSRDVDLRFIVHTMGDSTMFVQRIQELGNVYGRLEVIGVADKSPKDRHARWLCRCTCGEQCVVAGNDLRRGQTQSCGCLASELAAEKMQKFNRKLGRFGLPDAQGFITRNGVRDKPLVPVKLANVPGVRFTPLK